MINVGENNISVYAGNSEVSVYIGSELIYPLNFGELTGITMSELTWVTDISWEGGTGTSANCSYVITGYYDSGKTRKLNSKTTVEGSITADSTTSETRDLVGTLVLTATCSGFTATGSVDAYQEKYAPYPKNNEIWYTTSDGQTITPTSGLSPTSNTYSNGRGVMRFASDVTSIPESAFKGIETLLSVFCPSSVTSVGSTVIQYSNCTAFTAEYATSFPGHHTFMDSKLVTFTNNRMTTPNSTGMWERCYNLTSVELTSLTSFQSYCFANCTALTSMTLGTTPPAFGLSYFNAFTSMPSNGVLHVPAESVSTYETWKQSKSTPLKTWTVQAIT